MTDAERPEGPAEVEPLPAVVEEAPLVRRQLPTLSQMLRDPQAAEQAIRKYGDLLALLRTLSIQQTYPEDWVIHVRKQEGRVVARLGYLQDWGAWRASKPWAIEFLGKPKVWREDYKDGGYSWHFVADAICQRTGEIAYEVEGSRWSGSRFFQRLKQRQGFLDPTHVKNAAQANFHGRAVRALAGLGAVPVEVLETAGLDVRRCQQIEHEGRGGEQGEEERPPARAAARPAGPANPRNEAWGLLMKLTGSTAAAAKKLTELTGKTGLAELTDAQVLELRDKVHVLLAERQQGAPGGPGKEG